MQTYQHICIGFILETSYSSIISK